MEIDYLNDGINWTKIPDLEDFIKYLHKETLLLEKHLNDIRRNNL